MAVCRFYIELELTSIKTKNIVESVVQWTEIVSLNKV